MMMVGQLLASKRITATALPNSGLRSVRVV
jgi:hypothetical protein